MLTHIHTLTVIATSQQEHSSGRYFLHPQSNGKNAGTFNLSEGVSES